MLWTPFTEIVIILSVCGFTLLSNFEMPILPFYHPSLSITPRWFAGISVTSTCQRIESAMIGIHGQGSGAPVEIRKTISFDVPREIVECFNELQGILYDKNSRRPERDHSNVNIPTSLYHHVLRELASIEEEAVAELVGESHLTMNDVLAIGIHDTGVRSVTPEGLFYQGLCDASYLAEQTGLNIIDSFPTQDIAARGNGGPLFPLPAWIFLKSESRNRILIDLGRTAKLTFLPQAKNAFSHQKIQQRDVIPCGSLLDSLTWQLTGGKTTVDIGGRLAVQGCQIPDLLTNLRAAMAPRCDWMPLGLTPDRYLQIAARSAGEGHSHQDILCTAACFIAETVAEQVSAMITETASESKLEPELLVCGAGRLHGLLMNSISSQLRQRPLASILHHGIPVDTFDALCAAMMVLLAVDHIPGNLPHLTGSETVKTLGRITPGSITNWHRLLREMAGTKPADRTLRSAM